MGVSDLHDRAWWYWMASCVCLWCAVSVYPRAYEWAIAITLIQLVHYRVTEGGFSQFSVQVRIAFLVVLLLALPEQTRWTLWLPAIGTTFRVAIGYCFVARTLSLLPFNSKREFSWRLVREAYLTPPVQGSILNKLPPTK